MTPDVRRRWTSRLPLRTQLVALLVATVALVVLVTGLSATAALRGHLLDQVDTQLADTLRMPHGMSGGAPRPGGPGRRFAAPGSYVAALYSSSGALLRQEGLPAGDPDGPALPALDTASAASIGTQPFTVDGLSGDTRWRVQAQPLADGSTRVSALPLDASDAVVRRLVLVDVLIGLAALGGAGALAWWGVRRSLQPLVQVEQTAESIAAGDLSVRVPESDPRTEVGSLAVSFNSMVDRFEQAFTAQQQSEAQARASEQRMRQFVADASHELRTPLTSIRGFAELYRQGAVVDEEQLRHVMRRIEDEGTRMGALLEDLLLLARLDQQRPLDRAPVDLAQVAAGVTRDAQALVREHDVVFAPPGAGARTVVVGDKGRLRQVVDNLVGNAVAHTPAGTHVRVRVDRVADNVVLEVSDDGPGMPADVAARVFERFYRADSARTRDAGTPGSGSGLGLSIVAGIVRAHDGTSSVDSVPGAGTSFRVHLPASAD